MPQPIPGLLLLLPALIALPIGSFLGLLADRLPRGEPVLMGRSACVSCGTTLRPRELIPLVSYFLQRGRCRSCAAPIPVALPLIEAGSLATAIAAVLLLPDALVWPGAILGWLLLALAMADLRHGVLPDALTVPLVATGLGFAALAQQAVPLQQITGAALGWGVLALLAWAYRRLRQRDGMGEGDPLLLGAGGAWVGPDGIAPTILIAALATLAVVLVTSRARLDPTEAIPFGPGLALGLWLTWFSANA